jgi:hypothetical protein
MRVFLIVLAVSIALSFGVWTLGIAQRVWPAHPVLATTLIAWVCAVAVQIILNRDEAEEKQEQ